MSFIVNEDMFGRYCRIPTDTSDNMYIYKIVSRTDSNSYCDVPLMVQSKETLHKQVVPVLLVIYCGVDESKVQRVALSDCDIVPAADVVEVVRCKECKFYQDNNGGYPHIECKWVSDETPDCDDFCSFGERMDGEENA